MIRRKRDEKGFTLIELMVVIAIIGLLVAIVVPDLIKTREESTIAATQASLRGIQSALELYYTRYKYYPTTLPTLITEGYLQEGADKDPWMKNYSYQPVVEGGQATASNYKLASCGKDGRQGTNDDVEAPVNPSRHSFKQQGAVSTVAQ